MNVDGSEALDWDISSKLGDKIDFSFNLSPVKSISPTIYKTFDILKRYPVVPAGTIKFIRESCCAKLGQKKL